MTFTEARLAGLPLSDRERQVVALLAAGYTNQQIGARLFIAENTVKTHLARIKAKLGTSNRTTTAVVAVMSGQYDTTRGGIHDYYPRPLRPGSVAVRHDDETAAASPDRG